MALGPRLDLRQSQSLVMTPQLQQAIKLLALSNLEVETFIGEAIDANPLLEIGESSAPEPGDMAPEDLRRTHLESSPVDQLVAEGRVAEDRPLDIDASALDRDRDTGDGDFGGSALELFSGRDSSSSGSGGEGIDIDERGGSDETLAEHLHAQIGATTSDPQLLFVARWLIDQIDEAGYLTITVSEACKALGLSGMVVERALGMVQSLDPTGVGARNLAECIALQAKEADRYDPCMARLIDNLELVARGDVARLKRLCQVDDEDFADMLAELRSYNPRPGMGFGGGVAEAVAPDILIRAGKTGGWDIALNQATLPRLIVNRSYYVKMRGACMTKDAKAWLGEKLADANWLMKALDQRQKTILKVAAEIVKQQDGFFRSGVAHLRPLTLRTVADAISMHESTVSRVTSNKYLHCDRGTFELKYFFTSGVGSSDGEGASAEAVKAAIRQLIDAETPNAVLSDDALVDLLKAKGFDLARRTVAKYREAIGLGSSVQRRRQKTLAGVR
ncbi:RNA polymerase sigma-54 factor [Novosphingobium hassiacum]|uniref:RNA polymerase sigma-54 factor n=1 Tax=Novosphingobium hassiacum TaxID=173676 RepID=A0A7W6A1T0_9SPHN|nr:RNA polymerase factor sigma-54 [Novosphingobium hassiacum]MBB3862492.1 RNA polymerase sigma-54 factor [Novosphingobium hassiacum]